MPDELVLRWWWRHHGLNVEVEDSVEDAIRAQYYLDESDEGVSESIEVWAADGTYRKVDDDDPEVKVVVKKIADYWSSLRDASKANPITHSLKVTLPGEIHGSIMDSFHSKDEALKRQAELSPLLGERLQLVEHITPH